MNPPSFGNTHVPFLDLVDLASEKVGGRALYANDEFFAPKENLLRAEAPVFIADKFTEFGKWMDGWESRRKRELPGHDYCLVKLGLPGIVRGVNVDTAFFTGNFPEYCSIDACDSSTDEVSALQNAKWREILPKTKLQGGSANLLPVQESGRCTHLRLNIFPDGGVARLRVHGDVMPAAQSPNQILDLAAIENGGVVVTCNDAFFGPKDNLIFPGRAKTMGEGWETRRKRGPGNDWIIVRLAGTGEVRKLEIDTNHFKGNFPESCSIEGLTYRARDLIAADFRDRRDLAWQEILPRTKLQAHHQHFFEVKAAQAVDYVRLNIFPDGGVSRLRVHGVLTK